MNDKSIINNLLNHLFNYRGKRLVFSLNYSIVSSKTERTEGNYIFCETKK